MVQPARSPPSEPTAWQENQGREGSVEESADLPILDKLAGPITADLLYNCGAALWNRGRTSEAIEMLDAALRARPDYPEALCLGGFILGEAGQSESALRFYEQALKHKPDYLVAWSNSGKLLCELRRFDGALIAFDRALALAPDSADAWNSRAGALRELGRLEDSLAACEQALRLRPGFAEALLNQGTALMKLDRPEEALPPYRSAKQFKPSLAAVASCGEGLTLKSLGRFDEAMAAFDDAARLGSVDAVSNRGCLLLMLGDFEQGWEGYESRWLAGRSLKEALGVKFPTWSGKATAGERLLVMNDHGLGDTIQFSRYVALAARAGVEVTFLCPRKLHRLFAAHVGARLVDRIEDTDIFDAQIAVSSLPRAFGVRAGAIQAPAPYLKSEEALQRKWAKRIGLHGFKIGVHWQGNPNPEADIGRSFPLAALASLATLPNVRLISLQKGAGAEQLDDLPPGMVVETLGDDFDAGPDAFVDTAAVMSHLDLIITCDTSIAHLAGALGLAAWVALKRIAEWRWLCDREDSPWYPTMRLFRQQRRGDWSELFARMAASVEPLARPDRHVTRKRTIAVPSGVGELIDKITILEIKSEKISDENKLRNIAHELATARALREDEGLSHRVLDELTERLKAINAQLWEIEDALRLCEKRQDFGPSFVSLARSVYRLNDRRAELKHDINLLFNSAIVEEKSYA
jgi:tetratricopeptide (TPR) repeat protein